MQFEKHCSALLPLVKSLKDLHVNQNSRHTKVYYPGVKMQGLRQKMFLLYTKRGQQHNCQSSYITAATGQEATLPTYFR